MNCLANHGVNLEASLLEMERSITRSIPTNSISSIRDDLFLEAMESGLVAPGDALVTRRETTAVKLSKKSTCQMYANW